MRQNLSGGVCTALPGFTPIPSCKKSTHNQTIIHPHDNMHVTPECTEPPSMVGWWPLMGPLQGRQHTREEGQSNSGGRTVVRTHARLEDKYGGGGGYGRVGASVQGRSHSTAPSSYRHTHSVCTMILRIPYHPVACLPVHARYYSRSLSLFSAQAKLLLVSRTGRPCRAYSTTVPPVQQ